MLGSRFTTGKLLFFDAIGRSGKDHHEFRTMAGVYNQNQYD